jgi:hypothetical protein
VLPSVRGDAGYQAFLLLRLAFAVAPIAFGLDKFLNVLVDWPQYLAPWIDDILPGSAQDAMYAVGIVEILPGWPWRSGRATARRWSPPGWPGSSSTC